MNIEQLNAALHENRLKYWEAFYEHDVATKFYERISARVFHRPIDDGTEESKVKYEKLKEICKIHYGIQFKAERKLYEIEAEFDSLIDNFDNE